MKVEGNLKKGKHKKKWIGVFGEDMKACGVNKNVVRDRER